MIKASYIKYILKFKQPSGTSRGVLKEKETWFIRVSDNENVGIGECGILRGLSIDDRPDYEQMLQWVCKHIHLGLNELLTKLIEFPSILFGVEQAFLSLKSKTPFLLFPSDFTKSKQAISINGLVWMGEKNFMKKQIIEKINAGFDCIKLKIGAIDFEEEYDLLRYIRKEFSSKDIEVRVDANGGFLVDEALGKLNKLAKLQLHSIEQPIKQRQLEQMAFLCENTPLSIALDEELIGVFTKQNKEKIIATIKPQYIILKPSLVGGFVGSEEWIAIAQANNIGWWVTSALESNIGLNAISQWTSTLKNPLPQGLGTGGLYTNNFDSPLTVKDGHLHYSKVKDWKFNLEI